MYQIGEFSRRCQITIRTLRYYDELGILKPNVIDEYTGYRYYGDNQIKDYLNICILKELGFSLDEIKENLEQINQEFINRKLEESKKQLTVLQNRINALTKIQTKLRKGQNIMGVVVKTQSEYLILGKRVFLKPGETNKILKEVRDKLVKKKIKVKNSCIVNKELGYTDENMDAIVGYEIELPKVFTIDHCECKNREDVLRYRQEVDTFLKMIGKISKECYPLQSNWQIRNNAFYILKISCNLITKEDGYSELISFAKENNYQIIGAFIETYYMDTVLISVNANKLEKQSKESINCYFRNRARVFGSEFVNDEKMLGTWKVIDILPDKSMFNEKKQKAIIDKDNKYSMIKILPNGKINANMSWSKGIIIHHFSKGDFANNFLPMGNDNLYSLQLIDEITINNGGIPMYYIYKKLGSKK